MAQRQDQMWMPEGTPTISTNESSDEALSLEESQIVPEEGSSNDEEEDESSAHISVNNEESVANDDDLGLSESNIELVDELGTKDVESESPNDDHDAAGTDDSNLPLGQWVTMPKCSRRAARLGVIDPFVDVELLENHGT